ncbi:hypothetical protein DFJ58DRAFT_841184 [Suillus subalutaceus]|uniref:uncharacterized protein n=1 Tax=Suillus subalutaceus TaxID=48586 RepID=UPI001B871863|nr:uncharacterized protein DFJ58DRAFT_841184 [Suillus subalutaceus]KAG1855164.1 hypothetical protein DFJ58DRAFT_841184 [Suillus subalutaceus]
MSHMIPSGPYKIRNVLYVDRYVHMSGNKEFVGHDVAQIIRVHRYSNALPIQVNVKDVVQHLATLYDTETNLYLGIDQIDGKVKGFTDPQVLQLSSDDGVK